MKDDRPAFTARMFLRDYAFIARLHRNSAHSVNYHFAALATTAWFTVLTVLVLIGLCVLLRDAIPRFINPLTANRFVLLIECLVIPFAVDYFVEARIRHYKTGERPQNVDAFLVPRERLKWWASALSIALMTGGIAALLALSDAGSGVPLLEGSFSCAVCVRG
jgi:hypothetical protein